MGCPAGGTTHQVSTKSDALGAGQLWGRSAQCPVPGHEDADGWCKHCHAQICTVFFPKGRTARNRVGRPSLRKDLQPKAKGFSEIFRLPSEKKVWLPMIVPNFNNTLACPPNTSPKSIPNHPIPTIPIIWINYSDLTVLPHWNVRIRVTLPK